MNETKSRKGCNWLYVKIGAASLGIVSGISIFFPFICVYQNYHAAIWGLVSGVFAAWVLHLHILFLKNKLHKTYTSSKLRFMKLIGGVTSLVTVVFFVTYIVLAAVNHQGYSLHNQSYAPAATFTFMTFKWTFSLYWEGARYQMILESDRDSISPQLKEIEIDPSAQPPPPKGYAIYGYSYAPAATFTFMAFKWTFMLYWEGGRYQRFLERGPDFITPLLGNVKIDPKADLGTETEPKEAIESKSSKAGVFNQSGTAEKS